MAQENGGVVVDGRPDEIRLGTRWDLRGLDAPTQARIGAALEADAVRRRRGASVRLEHDRGGVELHVGPRPITADGIRRCLRELDDWSARIAAVLPPGIDERRLSDLHLRVSCADLSVKKLVGIAERAAPTLLLLAGDGATEPLGVDAVGDVIRVTIPGRLDATSAAWVVPALAGVMTDLVRAHVGKVPPDLIRHPRLCLAAPGAARVAIPQRDANRLPVLAEGRLTRVGGLNGKRPTPLVTAQQSLTVVFLYAEESVSRLVPPELIDRARQTILGELPLGVDANGHAPDRTAAVATVRGRRMPSRRHRRLTVVLVEPGAQARPTIVWMARAMSTHPDLDVLIAPWHQIDFAGGSVVVSGAAIRVVDEQVWPVSLDGARAADALLFDPLDSGSRPVGATERERAAMHRLSSLGMINDRYPWTVIDRLLIEASRRGAVTNAVGPEFSWGPKHQLEFHLRDHIRTGGGNIPRPATFIVAAAQVPSALATFARHGLACVVKPARGSWGEGIQVIRPGAPLHRALPDDTYVVQQLLPDPYLVGGRKIDVRGHVMIDLDDPGRSGPVGPLLVRRVGTDYVRGEETSEIANVAYQHRRGLPAEITPLEELAGIPREDADAIRSQLEGIILELVRAHARWSADLVATGRRAAPSRRLVIWGVDALVRKGDDGVQVFLVENNVYPQLYRRVEACDSATAAMLRQRFVPALLHRARVQG